MKANKKIIAGVIALTLVGGGSAYATLNNDPKPSTSQIQEDASVTPSGETSADGTVTTTPETTTQAPSAPSNNTSSPSTPAEAPEEAPAPAPITVTSQTVRWEVDATNPQSFKWFCDRSMSDGSVKTLSLGAVTEYGNSSGTPKIKYRCPAL